MSATSENYTLDDFCSDDSICASCGVDEDPSWSVPANSPVGRCIGLAEDSEVCDECFQQHSSVYRVRGDER